MNAELPLADEYNCLLLAPNGLIYACPRMSALGGKADVKSGRIKCLLLTLAVSKQLM